MTDEPITRRAWLRAVGSVGLAGVPVAHASGNESLVDVEPTALLMPGDAVPPGFDQVTTPGQPPLVEALGEADPILDDAVSASQGYVAGDDPRNPEWVLGSLAVVCDERAPREAVEAAGTVCHEAPVIALASDRLLVQQLEWATTC